MLLVAATRGATGHGAAWERGQKPADAEEDARPQATEGRRSWPSRWCCRGRARGLMERGATWEARSGGGVSLLSLSLWKGHERGRGRDREEGGEGIEGSGRERIGRRELVSLLDACVGGAGRERGERWGAGAAARVRGAPAGPWAGLGWPGLRGRLGCKALSSLSYIFFNRKAKRERKRKGGLGKENAQGDNFLGLTKICSYQEK